MNIIQTNTLFLDRHQCFFVVGVLPFSETASTSAGLIESMAIYGILVVVFGHL
jgi:hypothetical protein